MADASNPLPRYGFTLIELVIVTMIVGILSAVAAPRFADSLARYRVDAAARQLRSDLAEAKLRAKASSSTQTVQFDTAAQSYTLTAVPHIDHPAQDYCIQLGVRFQSTIVSADCGGDTELNFDGYGMPDSEAEIVVQCGAHAKTVKVNEETGLASVL